jgi:hypothetical protein
MPDTCLGSRRKRPVTSNRTQHSSPHASVRPTTIPVARLRFKSISRKVFGGLGLFEALLGTTLDNWWVGANLAAAFLHYTYDGLIWKLRSPATAAALGAV